MPKKLSEVRKKIVNTKQSKPTKDKPVKPKTNTKQGSDTKDTVEGDVERSILLCKALIVMKREAKSTGKLPKQYKQHAKELGELISKLVSNIKSNASDVLDAKAKVEIVVKAKLPEIAHKTAASSLKQLNGIHTRIKDLNTTIGNEIKNAKSGLEPKTILRYLPKIGEILVDAKEAKREALDIYAQWGSKIGVGDRFTKNTGWKSGDVLPKFSVNKLVTPVGTPKNPAEKKLVGKLVMANNLGASKFPDPYSAIYEQYASARMNLDSDVAEIVRLLTHWSASHPKYPKQHSILELFHSGIAQKSDTAKFDTDEFNANFDAVVKNIVKKLDTQEAVDFIRAHSSRADASKLAMVKKHLAGGQHGVKILDLARRLYIRNCREWFITYLPTFQ